MDKFVNFFLGKLWELIASVVFAMLATFLIHIRQLHPSLLAIILFFIALGAMKLVRFLQYRRESMLVESLREMRDKKPESSLIDDFKLAKVSWGLWYAGTNIRADKVLDLGRTKGRVLLLSPSRTNEALQRVVTESKTEFEEVVSDIIYTAKHAIKGGFKTGFHTKYIGRSFTIYDIEPSRNRFGELVPDSHKAWIVVKHLEPGVGAGERGMDRIYKNTDEQKFNEYFDEFQEVWDKRAKVILDKGIVVTKQHHFEVSNIIDDTRA